MKTLNWVLLDPYDLKDASVFYKSRQPDFKLKIHYFSFDMDRIKRVMATIKFNTVMIFLADKRFAMFRLKV